LSGSETGTIEGRIEKGSPHCQEFSFSSSSAKLYRLHWEEDGEAPADDAVQSVVRYQWGMAEGFYLAGQGLGIEHIHSGAPE